MNVNRSDCGYEFVRAGSESPKGDLTALMSLRADSVLRVALTVCGGDADSGET